MKTASFAMSSDWFHLASSNNTRARIRLFCFPYAGGGTSTFRLWSKNLSPEIEICSVQLPGREKRIEEPVITDMQQLLNELSNAIQAYMDKPFAFFGHSMGALIAFELARMLRRQRMPQPRQLCLSAYGAPQLKSIDRPQLHRLPDNEFIERLRLLKGTPEALLREPEIMQLLLPTIRGDFTVTETYKFYSEDPLNIPIIAFWGADDSICFDRVAAWKQQTTGNFLIKKIKGNHFFIHQYRSIVLNEISNHLLI